MNIDILKKYKINFQNQIDDFGVIDKMPYTNLGSLTLFLYELDVFRIESMVLPIIKDVLNETIIEIEHSTNLVDANFYKDKVVFFEFEDDEFSVPTIDLKQIVEGWRDFLQTSPLNGTKL